jgi:hypothetical protein
VNDTLRVTLIGVIVCALSVVFAAHCLAQEASRSQKAAGKPLKKGTKSLQNEVPASLFPDLEVRVDSCYVYLQPDERSPHFGPLLKGERIKRLDRSQKWARVWIPRLLASGWIPRGKVKDTGRTISSEGGIPASLITVLSVLKGHANIRKAPTMKSRIILVAKGGQEFWLLNERRGWYQVGIPHLKTKGWIYGKLVERKGNRRRSLNP